MKKSPLPYLILTFAIAYSCFGLLAYLALPLSQVLARPLYLLVVCVGCLSPLLAALALHLPSPLQLGSLSGLIDQLRTGLLGKGLALAVWFAALHYGLAGLLGAVAQLASPARGLQMLLPMLVLAGLPEIGWQLIAQPMLEQRRGYWRAAVSVGLLRALLYLPLLFVPGFGVPPQLFLPFAAYLTGISLLQSALFRQKANVVCNILCSTLLYAAAATVILQQGDILFGVAAADGVVAYLYSSPHFAPKEAG